MLKKTALALMGLILGIATIAAANDNDNPTFFIVAAVLHTRPCSPS